MEVFSSTETGLLCFERVLPGSSERMNDSNAGNESLLDIHSSSSSTNSCVKPQTNKNQYSITHVPRHSIFSLARANNPKMNERLLLLLLLLLLL